MKTHIAFYITRGRTDEQVLAGAFNAGLTPDMTQEVVEWDPADGAMPPAVDCDRACVVGIRSRPVVELLDAAGIPFIYFDKAYQRAPKGVWWRFAFNSNQPTDYLMRHRFSDERRRDLGWEHAPWRRPGRKIVFCGSSEAYHAFHVLSRPHDYAGVIVSRIRRFDPDVPIVYRVKRGWHFDGTPPREATFSQGAVDLLTELQGARMLVTHGSNSCVDALRFGVPAIVLGNGATAPVCDETIRAESVANPRRCDADEANALLANLAWMQATNEEISQGYIWQVARAVQMG